MNLGGLNILKLCPVAKVTFISYCYSLVLYGPPYFRDEFINSVEKDQVNSKQEVCDYLDFGGVHKVLGYLGLQGIWGI